MTQRCKLEFALAMILAHKCSGRRAAAGQTGSLACSMLAFQYVLRHCSAMQVINIALQYVSAAIGFSANEQLAQLNKNFTYQVYFSNNATGAAQELNADPRSAIMSCAQIAPSVLPPTFLQLATSFLQPWWDFLKAHKLKQIPFSGIMTTCVEDYMVASYQKQGFFPSKRMVQRLRYWHYTYCILSV
jgi:hypothetical protein